MLSEINKELTMLGEKEIEIVDKHLIEVYEMTSSRVANEIGFQQTIPLPAERVIHSIWCRDGKD